MKKIIYVGIVMVLIISGCATNYNIFCLDEIALKFCKENEYNIGQAERASYGFGLNYNIETKEVYIECREGSCVNPREISCDYEKKRFRYLQEELEKCKPK